MKKETIDESTNWESLHEVASLFLRNSQQHVDVVEEFKIELFELAYKVGVINGFDWMSWSEPVPSLESIQTFNKTITKRHITRILREEKFSWGSLDENIRNKILPSLCVRLYDLHHEDLITP
jgi:hypothetical protein